MTLTSLVRGKHCDGFHVASFHKYMREHRVYLVKARLFALLYPLQLYIHRCTSMDCPG